MCPINFCWNLLDSVNIHGPNLLIGLTHEWKPSDLVSGKSEFVSLFMLAEPRTGQKQDFDKNTKPWKDTKLIFLPKTCDRHFVVDLHIFSVTAFKCSYFERSTCNHVHPYGNNEFPGCDVAFLAGTLVVELL